MNSGDDHSKDKGRKFDGVRAVVEMLDGLDADARKKLMAQVAARDPRLAREISERLFSFEMIVRLEATDMQKLIREVPRPTLALALRAGAEQVRGAIFANLSGRARQELEDEMTTSGPRKLSDVRAAQVAIAELARKYLEK